MPRKKKTKSVREHTSYCVEIFDWDISYSLLLDKDRRINLGPYWEHICLNIIGNFIYPEKLQNKSVEAQLLGDRDETRVLNTPEKFQEHTPKCIGSLTVRGEIRSYLGSLPFDTLSFIISSLAAGKIKFLIFNGYTLRYGSAEIFSLHFQKEFDEEGWL